VPKDDCCDGHPGPDEPGLGDGGAVGPLRRRAVLGGLAAVAGGALATLTASVASAQSEDTVPPDTDPVVTGADQTIATTVPPRRPTTEDMVQLGFAQTIELAAVQLYDEALAVLTEPVKSIAVVFRSHHQAYGEQLGGQLGRRAPGVANRTLVSERTAAFGARTEPAIHQAMYELETSLAASYSAVLGTLKGTDGAALVASIQPVEARHAVVLGQILELDDEELMPVLEGDEAGVTLFTLSAYPVIT
jgi:hypothetical protein